MLLDMLATDAGKHCPDYSTHRSPSPAHGSFLSQMPLSLLGSVLRKQNASPAPASAPANRAEQPVAAPDNTDEPKSPMKADAEAPVISPTSSRPASSSSVENAEEKPRKRAPRPKTTYNLAQPPPSSHPGRGLHIRPKVVLQLHQVIPLRRPKPVYEVIPYSILAPVSTRRLARTFRPREKLGPHDFLIVRAEEYGTKDDEEKSDDERFGARDVIGIICPGKKEESGCVKAEVLIDDGSSWEVTKTPNGGYEFSYTDEHNLTLRSRWVPKPAHIRRQSTMSSSTQTSPIAGPEDRKFTFSTIYANTRRHPIIATMTRDRIEVLDSYIVPSATSPSTPSNPASALSTPAATPIADMASFLENANERQPVKTDDALRRFIVVSGIWVAFAENWSPAYSFSKTVCSSPLSTISTSTNPRPLQTSRTVSMPFIDSPTRSSSPSSTIDENRRTIPRIFRTGTQLLHRNASFTNQASSPTAEKASSLSGSPIKTRSRRSNSTGNAELPSKTGKKRFGLALEDQILPETDEERQNRRSSELLRIRELSLPSPLSIPSPTQSQANRLTPIPSLEPPLSDRSVSPTSLDPRAKKTRSAYNPVTTAGLWDSGVVEGRGLRPRPTSLVVVNEKKKKAKRKEERSKSREKKPKEKKEKKEKDARRKSESFRQLFTGMFRREKTTA